MLPLSLYIFICLRNKQKAVIVLAKDLIEDLGNAVMNPDLIGFLCMLGIQYIYLVIDDFQWECCQYQFYFRIYNLSMSSFACKLLILLQVSVDKQETLRVATIAMISVVCMSKWIDTSLLMWLVVQPTTPP